MIEPQNQENNAPGKNSSEDSGTDVDFPVVGIGASAGGLESLQEFFKEMVPEPGAAFVIIQHLSPDHKSLMDEILARFTRMTIHRVEHGMKVEKNHIYLIPPRMNMTIYHGQLMLSAHVPDGSLNLPIDIFLRSLAQDKEKNAIGIILSGTGSDGALGIRAIKEYGGIAMVQDDQSAKFDGMPRSSISTGMVDFILPPALLADELANYIQHPLIQKKESIEQMIMQEQSNLSQVFSILRDTKGVDFSNYKESTIIRRLEKRISLNRFETIGKYLRFLENDEREAQALYDDLLIGVTRFFRDKESFSALEDMVLPELFKETSKKELRVWVTGCSTGEEVYSLGILLDEYMKEQKAERDIKIFATDIDDHALEYASIGHYPESLVTDVSPERVSQYFVHKDGGYQVNEHLRGMIIFARHNLLSDPPFSKIDLVSCRNLLIYLNTAAQQRVLSMFYMGLVDSGFMFLGSSESLGNLSSGFNILNNKAKIFRKNNGQIPAHVQSFAATPRLKTQPKLTSMSSMLKARPRPNVIAGLFDEIMGGYVPASVIVDEHYNVIHTIHDVSRYISLPVGEVSLNILKMLPSELSVMVSSLLRRARNEKKEIILKHVSLPHCPEKDVTLICRLFTSKNDKSMCYIISFSEGTKTVRAEKKDPGASTSINAQYRDHIDELEKELQSKSESLQAAVEELETSNEELQSSNEELIASNEELQSTNEELQSVNEELYTVNSEHISKIEELTELNSDIDNLMKDTRIGTIFVDRNMRIRKVNSTATELTNTYLTDIGRPIEHLSFGSLYTDFRKDIQSVVTDLQPRSRELEYREDQWCMVKIMPYRTAENAVDGLMITFIDITALKRSQDHAVTISNRLDTAMEMGGISWWTWDIRNDQMVSGNARSSMLGYRPGEIAAQFESWMELIHEQDRTTMRQSIDQLISGEREVYEIEYRIRGYVEGFRWVREKAAVTDRDEDGAASFIAGTVMDITDEKKIKLAEERFKLLFETLEMGVVYQNAMGEIVDANAEAQRMLGLTLDQLKGVKSIDPRWKAIRHDGTDFPGNEHPSMIALSTGKSQHNVVMGVYNPEKKRHCWVNVNAVPLFEKNGAKPYQVYATFEEIKNHKSEPEP